MELPNDNLEEERIQLLLSLQIISIPLYESFFSREEVSFSEFFELMVWIELLTFIHMQKSYCIEILCRRYSQINISKVFDYRFYLAAFFHELTEQREVYFKMISSYGSITDYVYGDPPEGDFDTAGLLEFLIENLDKDLKKIEDGINK